MINVCGDELTIAPQQTTRPTPTTPVSPIAAKPTTTATTSAPVTDIAVGKPTPITTTVTAKPATVGVSPSEMKAPTAAQMNCPPNNAVCVVNDPLLYSSPKPICYNISTHVCVNDNFLCPTHAPNVCGRACYHKQIYTCKYSDIKPVGARLMLKAQQIQEKTRKPSAAAPLSSAQPILDALAQMKAKQTTAPPKVQAVSQPIVDVLTKPVAPALSQTKQVPIQQGVKTLPTTGNPIVDVLTNPSLLSTPANQLKSSAANQPSASTTSGQTVQAPLRMHIAKQPVQVSGQPSNINPNKPRN